jgi:hypothetical protein
VLERALCLVGHINLALAQPLDQVIGRQVDDFHLRAVYDPVGHGLAHAHSRDLGDDVVQAFQMLDVDGGVDIVPAASSSSINSASDAAGLAHWCAPARRRTSRPARQDVNIHLKLAAFAGDAPPWAVSGPRATPRFPCSRSLDNAIGESTPSAFRRRADWSIS